MTASRRLFVLSHATARQRAADYCREAPEGWSVVFAPPKRTTEQNARMWAMLTDIARQVEWHGQHLTTEEWKDVLTAGLKRQRAVPGIDGGFVILGAHTSGMSKSDMSELIELAFAFGAEHGVEWSDPTMKSQPQREEEPHDSR